MESGVAMDYHADIGEGDTCGIVLSDRIIENGTLYRREGVDV